MLPSLRRRLGPDALAASAGERLPAPALRALLGGALRGLDVALCLHRVGPRRATDWQPGLSMPPGELEALIELLLSSRAGPGDRWLTVSFDDGYRDAGQWLQANARRFPRVEFLFFACPEKAEARAARALCDAPFDVDAENRRPELAALADDASFALCTPDELRALRADNVTLGNHTNLHLSAARSPDAVVREDLLKSSADFERLFGPMRHLAFPFGTPGAHVGARHVAMARAHTACVLWTTEPRPYRPAERRGAAVLPRFPVDGTRPASATAAWVAARALAFRARGTRHQLGAA